MNAITKENKEILEAFQGLRVADVRDGMDWCGMMHYGSVDHSIMPLFRTIKIGIARTVKCLPFQGPMPFITGDEYSKWSEEYYKKTFSFPFLGSIEEGDFICLDQCSMDVGVMGSNSALLAVKNGAVGFVCNGGTRDSDEMILEKIPFWGSMICQPMVQGRIIYEAQQVPIHIGGVVIYPGDVVAADGDGVVIVPRKIAFDVAKYAHQELDSDKKGRKKLYLSMNMELDETVL